MNITIGLALLVVCATVYALIKRYETRLVLLTAGLVMTLIAMDPMAAFKQFDKSMTNLSLIHIASCENGLHQDRSSATLSRQIYSGMTVAVSGPPAPT